MSVVLTNAQLDYLARRADWKFEFGTRDARNAIDSAVYTGDGVDDLDRLIARVTGVLGSVLIVDVGSSFSDYLRITVDDVYALRQRFIEVWGTVSKPAAYYDAALTQASKEADAGGTQGDVMPGTAVENPGQLPGLATPNPPGLGRMSDWQDFGDGHTAVPPRTQPDQTPQV